MKGLWMWDKGFSEDNIIGKHDKYVKNKIKSQLKDGDVFINTTWLEIDKDLESIFSQKVKRAILYSGPDWENTNCIYERRKAHQFVSDNSEEVVHIGNFDNENYFCFWLDFLKKHPFPEFDFFDRKPEKKFMSLNRKPHDHRVELIDSFESAGLIDDGYVSLGGRYTLDEWENEVGDKAVAGDVGITNDITSLGNPELWNNHRINIVSETTQHTNFFISEKTFKPIVGCRPFMILGDVKVTDYLKRCGFDVFEDIFGTGHNCKWHSDRIRWIILALQTVDVDLLELKERLLYNKEHFKIVQKQNRERLLSLPAFT